MRRARVFKLRKDTKASKAEHAPPIEFGVEDEPGFDKLPAPIRDLHRWAMSRNPARPDAKTAEACIADLRDSTPGNFPLIVVSTANDSRGYPELQASLLALSSNSRQIIAAESFHSIEISQPEVVIRAIRWAVEAAQQ